MRDRGGLAKADFVAGRNRLAIVARQHGIKNVKDSDSIAKLLTACLRRGDESELWALLVEITIFTRSRAKTEPRRFRRQMVQENEELMATARRTLLSTYFSTVATFETSPTVS